ncbi:unnamed protein product, partial [Choristocarpus tenellus]
MIQGNFSGVEHLSLGTAPFSGQHTYSDVKLWIQKVMSEYFSSFMGEDVQPCDVFLAGTIDQGANILNALRELNVPVLTCTAHKLNASVMWALGINGTKETGKNKEGRELVRKGDTMARAFSHSAINHDALHDAQ